MARAVRSGGWRCLKFFFRRLRLPRIGLCKETRKMHKLLGGPFERQFCNCTYD